MSRFLPRIIDYLNQELKVRPRIALILGSGLSDTVNQIDSGQSIKYSEIPHYPQSTVPGHAGEFIAGRIMDIPVIVARGRFHYYEGYDFETITLPIRVFKKLGVDLAVITNAAGSARSDMAPGTIMVIRGHMDGTFRLSVDTPTVVSGIPYYSEELLDILKKSVRDMNVDLREGVYCWTQGPSFETAAEVEYFREHGADAVGMSTVPEILTAGEIALKSVAISCITNFGAGISKAPLTHEEVIETTGRMEGEFNRLITTFLVNYINSQG